MSNSMNSGSVILGVLILTVTPTHAAATDCANPKHVSLPHATITMAEMVGAGSFRPHPGGRGSVCGSNASNNPVRWVADLKRTANAP